MFMALASYSAPDTCAQILPIIVLAFISTMGVYSKGNFDNLTNRVLICSVAAANFATEMGICQCLK